MNRPLPSYANVLFAFILLAGEASRAEGVFPAETWQRATPESQGVDHAELKAAVDFMDQQFGPDGAKELVIIRNGYLIWEGPRADAYHPIRSCTKTFTGTVLGLLIDDGLCALDAKAAEREVHLADQYPLYSRIKLRDLASMCGGYQGEVKDVREDQPWGVSGTVDGVPLNNPPGNPGGAGAGGVKTTARELARFGLLYLNRGNWNGRQLLSASYVDQAITNQVPVSGKYRNHDFRGRYGFYWWVNGIMATGRRPWPSAPPKTYTAHGRGCNFCFVIPEWNMVVVRMGTAPISTGNIAKGDRLCDEFFRRSASAIEVSQLAGE